MATKRKQSSMPVALFLVVIIALAVVVAGTFAGVPAGQQFAAGTKYDYYCNLPKVVGQTSNSYTGNVGGYVAADQLCKSEYGINAHVCGVDEVHRSRICGSLPTTGEGRYNTYITPLSSVYADCNSWKSSNSNDISMNYFTSLPGNFFAALVTCDLQTQFLCCK